jgi:uncharacterized cupin superfamily protein
MRDGRRRGARIIWWHTRQNQGTTVPNRELQQSRLLNVGNRSKEEKIDKPQTPGTHHVVAYLGAYSPMH